MNNLIDLGATVGRRHLLRGAALGAAGLAGAALIGCGGDDDPTPAPTAGGGGGGSTATATATPAASDIKRGGTLTVDAGSPNPNVLAFGFNVVNRPIQHTVWEQLIGLTPDYQINPVLAETFEFNSDASALHVVLRQGVEFHNGRPMTADDVAFSVDYFSNAESSGQLKGPFSQGVAEMKVVDDRTIDFTFNGPRPALADMFALLRIIDRDTFPQVSEMRELVGTGPFKFVSFTPDVGYVLERNENYWREGEPYIDRIEGKLYADTAARELALRSGELLWADNMSYASIAAFASDSNIKAVSRGKAGSHYFGMVVNKPPFDDVRVRRAVTLAIDRQRLSDEWAEGVVAPTALPWPVESPAYKESEDFPNLVSYDPDQASALIAEAGAAGAHITVQVGSGDEAVGQAQYLQDDLNAIGLDCEIVVLEPTVALQQLRDREIQSHAWLGKHGFANYAHPGSMMNAAQQFQVPNASNFNPDGYQQLLSDLQSAPLGSPELAELVSRWNNLNAWEDPWCIALLASEDYRAMNAKVKGDEGGNLSVTEAAFKQWWIDA